MTGKAELSKSDRSYTDPGRYFLVCLGVILSLFLPISGLKLQAQGPCGFDELHLRLMASDPDYARQVRQLNDRIYERAMLERDQESFAKPNYTLPVVVHIITPPGTLVGVANNLSDQEVARGIDLLNQAFSNTGAFVSPNGTDVGIQFCLARRDPMGRPTSGITRNESILVNDPMCNPGTNSGSDGQIKQIVSWDCRRYINVWLVTDLFNGAFGCGLAGYAYFPGAPCTVDGIVQESRYWNTPGGAVVTAHEMGHYLGLHHTFNGGCTNADCLRDGDLVCDTPPDNSASFAACNTNSCNTDQPDLPDDNYNFMDYSGCRPARFTQGQATRMIAALESARSGLIQSNACQIVGDYDLALRSVTMSGDFCSDTLCPVIVFSNDGLVRINSMTLRYSIDGGPDSVSQWTGSMDPLQSVTIQLPCIRLPYGAHVLVVTLLDPNQQADLYPDNNSIRLSFSNFPRPELGLASFSPTRCKSDGTITLSAMGGTAPYDYSISGRNYVQTDPFFQLLTSGSYLAQVTDANGCTDTLTVVVPDSCTTESNKKFILNNDAVNTGGDCYRLTDAANYQAGSMWYEDKVDFGKSFDVFFDFNLGCYDRNGADGMAFVLQPISTSIGVAGGGIGYAGVRPSLAIEFDTWENGEYSDPSYDHLAIMKNGNTSHNNPDNLAGPVHILPTQQNAEDCQWHKGLIRWIAPSRIIEVYVDCDRRLRLNIDLVKEIFSNDPNVYFGFTSATGGAVNVHQVCLKYITGINDIPDQIICRGEKIQLAASPVFKNYSWTPTLGVSNPASSNPVFAPDSSARYFLRMTDECGQQYSDTVFIEVRDISLDVTARLADSCAPANDVILEVSNAGSYPDALFSIDGQRYSKDNIFRTRYQNRITVYAQAGNCIASRVVDLSDRRVPLGDSLIFLQAQTCRDSGIVVVTGKGGKTPYEYSLDLQNWNPEGTFKGLTPGNHKITIRDALGCKVERDITIEDFKRKLILNVDSSRLSMDCCDPNAFVVLRAEGSVPYYYYSLNEGPWNIESRFTGLSAGRHKFLARDEYGCVSDSIELEVLDHRQPDTSIQSIAICARDSFDYNGRKLWKTGSYFDIFKNRFCCDSLVRTDLFVYPENISRTEPYVCPGGNYRVGNRVYDRSGMYLDTLTSALGCDSIIQTTLTVLTPAGSNWSPEICPGEYVEVGGRQYQQNGFYTDTLRSFRGCDSIVQTHLIVKPSSLESKAHLICEYASVRVGNSTYELPGVYVDTFVNQYGCDSIIQTTLRKDTLEALLNVKPALCFGIDDGELECLPVSGIPPFEFSLDANGPWSVQSRLSALPPGDYQVYFRDSLGCVKELRASLPVPFKLETELSAEVTILLGEKISLEPLLNFVPARIVWSPSTGLSCTDCLNPLASPITDTWYTIELTDENGCTQTARVLVKVRLEGDLFIPNAFTPNGDGVNDRVRVFSGPAFRQVDLLQVYSRWGELLYEQKNFDINDPTSGWDGRCKGQLLNPGVYLCRAVARRIDGVLVELTVDVSLIR